MVDNCAHCGKRFSWFETKYWNPQDDNSKLCVECSKRIKNKSANNKKIGLKERIKEQKEKAEQQKKIFSQKNGKQRIKNKRNKKRINSDSDPLKILKLRFAKGEITKKEYQETREMIQDN